MYYVDVPITMNVRKTQEDGLNCVYEFKRFRVVYVEVEYKD